MKIAIVGCAHGELDKIYESVRHLETAENLRVDLLICCGDFQSVRNHDDLNCMAVPQCYRTLNTFYKYYSGELKPPCLTIFVGGNHEASNFLCELPYGGWVAPGIYYLGFANVLNIGQLRIGGLSGIYGKKFNHHMLGHFECPPFNDDTLRSVYHMRQIDAFRLKQLKPNQLDIFISHDWPRGIHEFGDTRALFRTKPYFQDDASSGQLGNPLLGDVLGVLKPKYWFSAHLHVKFPALVNHEDGSQTKFLALDKCLPNRKYLQIVDIGAPIDSPLTAADFQYDVEWLSILRLTSHLTSTSNRVQYMPGPVPGSNARFKFTPTEKEIAETRARFQDNFQVPENFRWTAPPLEDETTPRKNRQRFKVDASSRPDIRQKFYINPETSEFCNKVGVINLNSLLAKLRPQNVVEAYYLQMEKEDDQAIPDDTTAEKVGGGRDENPDEIVLDEEDNGQESGEAKNLHEEVAIRSHDALIDDNPNGINLEETDKCCREEESINQKRHYEILDREHVVNPDEGNEDQSTSNAMKKFKRRNADMYSNQEDFDN